MRELKGVKGDQKKLQCRLIRKDNEASHMTCLSSRRVGTFGVLVKEFFFIFFGNGDDSGSIPRVRTFGCVLLLPNS